MNDKAVKEGGELVSYCESGARSGVKKALLLPLIKQGNRVMFHKLMMINLFLKMYRQEAIL